jgi:lipopolysaccharide/colanic/teichoic acid biosynthesis glycosyltransferase
MDHLIRRECARADRNGEVFSLVLFRVAGNGKRRRSLAAHRLARVMLKRARLTDDVGWVGEQHLAVILPDTSPQGARAFADGVCNVIARRDLRPLAMVYTYPRDGATNQLMPELGRLGALATKGAATRKVNGNGHSHINGEGATNGHSHHNGHNGHNGHANGHANGNGHSHHNHNGHSNGHSHMNGNGHANGNGTALLEANGDSSAVATCEPCPTISLNLVAAKATPEKLAQPQVVGVEELLALPMPRWKRMLDIIMGSIMLVALSPIFAIAAIAIKMSSPGPVIFKQRRSGLGGKPFNIYKFRTMIVGAEKQQQELRKLNEQDGPAFKLTHDPRVTRIGHILRKTSIDELPQLWNILRGEMSLVGPRPLPIAEQEGCEQWQRHRLNVTPGITCIWQVKGRSTVSFAEWVRMDVEYIRRRTILHDLIIIFSTIPSVLLRKGAR